MTQKELTDHEKRVQKFLLEGTAWLSGFPDSDQKLDSLTRAYARFASTEPYELKFPDHLRPHYDEAQQEEFLKPFRWKDGIIPMEWLADKIADTCRFFPMPIEARAIYCEAGFVPLDGQSADSIAQKGAVQRAED